MSTVEALKTALSEVGLLDDIRKIREVCDETNKKLDTVVQDVDMLKNENIAINYELEKMKNTNIELQTKLNDLDQYGRKMDLIVRNVPEIENENLYGKINDIAAKLGVTLREFDIVVTHRLPTRNGIKPIIVRFR